MNRYSCGRSPGPFTVPVSASVWCSSFISRRRPAEKECERKPGREQAASISRAGVGPRSVDGGLLGDAAVDVGERVDEDEGRGVVLLDERADAADLQSRDDAEDDVLLGVGQPAAAP